MTYRIAETAKNQIRDIFDYYYVFESPERAIKVLDSFYNTFKKITQNPFTYPVCFSPPMKGVISSRKGVIHKTFIFKYDIYETHIEILDIYHGKRDI